MCDIWIDCDQLNMLSAIQDCNWKELQILLNKEAVGVESFTVHNQRSTLRHSEGKQSWQIDSLLYYYQEVVICKLTMDS